MGIESKLGQDQQDGALNKPSPEEIKFGSSLREARENAGYTLRGLAKAIDVSPSYVSRFERGERPTSKRIVNAIADEFETSRFDLLEAAGHGESWKHLTIWEREVIKRAVDSKRLEL